MRTFTLTHSFRWFKRLSDEKPVLQQASVCLEDGSLDWNDVPVHYEESDINAAQEKQWSHEVGESVSFNIGLIGQPRIERTGKIRHIDEHGIATVVDENGGTWSKDLCGLDKIK